MANRFQNPFPEFYNDTPTPREGARLFFYESGGSTPLATYSDSGLSVLNPNPVVLDEFGRPPNAIFLQTVDYKVVLAQPGTDEPPSDVIWTADPVRSSDFSLLSKRQTGDGSPNGNVAGTAASAGVLPDEYWDYTNAVLYECTTTGSASTAVWTALNIASVVAIPPPQGRLCATSGVPVMVTDQDSVTALYYEPFVGNLVPIYNGASFISQSFVSPTSLALASQHAANTAYDVFAINQSGVVTLVTGPAWSSSAGGTSSRGTGAGTTQLQRVNGYLVNAVSMTGRNGATTYTVAANQGTYLGTILTIGSAGHIGCVNSVGQSRVWSIWNAFNRIEVDLLVADPTASWTSTSATVRVSNGGATNKALYVIGLAEEWVDCEFSQDVQLDLDGGTNAVSSILLGIGDNSTTVMSGQQSLSKLIQNTISGDGTKVRQVGRARYMIPPRLGVNNIYPLEAVNNIGVLQTFFGTSVSMQLRVRFRA